MTVCALCMLPLDGRLPNGRHQVMNPKQGLSIEIGYSDGGWGHRRTHIKFSDEVCTGCYARVMPLVEQMKAVMMECRGSEYKPSKGLGEALML